MVITRELVMKSGITLCVGALCLGALCVDTMFLGAGPLGAAPVQELANPAAPGSLTPNLTRSPGGRVVLSWLEPAQGGMALKFSVRETNAWTPPRTVVTRANFDKYPEAPPWVERLSDATMVAVWAEQLSGGGKWPGNYLYSSVSGDGGKSWSEPAVVHTDRSKSEHSFASLAPLDSGGALLVWLDARDYESENRYRLMSAVIQASGEVRDEQTIDPDVCTCCPTALTASGSSFLVSYRGHTPEEIRDITYARRVNDAWDTPALLSRDGWHINGCPVNGPSLASNDTSVVAAWFTAANEQAKVRLAWSQDGGKTFSSPRDADIQNPSGRPVGRPSLALFPNQRFALAWLHRGSTQTELRLVWGSGSGSLSDAAIVSRGKEASMGYPRMQALSGSVLLCWGGSQAAGKIHTAILSQP